MLTKCQLPLPEAALKKKTATPGWLDPGSRINLEMRWRICGAKASGSSQPSFANLMYVLWSKGMVDFFFFFLENLSCKTTGDVSPA